MSQDQVFDSALSLPPAERADLAFQLLQTLTPPGEDVTRDEFGTELHARIAAFRRGDLPSFSLEETRQAIGRRLQERRP